jgi:hypothetical protein
MGAGTGAGMGAGTGAGAGAGAGTGEGVVIGPGAQGAGQWVRRAAHSGQWGGSTALKVAGKVPPHMLPQHNRLQEWILHTVARVIRSFL